MRTRPASPNPSRPLRVNVVTDDGLVLQRLAYLDARTPFRLLPSAQPLPPGDVDVYFVDVRHLHHLVDRVGPLEAVAPAVLAWGSGQNLRAAFLAGCSDYLREPWDIIELESRLERVAAGRAAALSAIPGIVLEGRCIRLPDGRAVKLSAHEAVVAGMLFANQGAIVTRRALAYALWGRLPSQTSRAVDMHVSALRRKLGVDLISCVRGQGYVVSVTSLPVGPR